MIGIILMFLFLALVTGVISFGGFLAGATFLVFGKILFFVFVILFIGSIIRWMSQPPMPPRNM